MTDDNELLRRYSGDRDQAAFAELVRRHVNLVHSAALRQVNGDAHLAQDVTQRVFADLAQKADTLRDERVLAGWLFVSTRYAAGKLVRGERRRKAREQEAHMMQELLDEGAARLEWERVRPVLDEALGELSTADREAILLRFFENRGFAAVGARLQLSENSARMRVERALDKLHALLTRRGVTSTTGALAAVLANQAVVAAPAGLAGVVTGGVLTATGVGTAAAGGATITFMGMTKLNLGVVGMITAAGAAAFVVQQQTAEKWQRELSSQEVPADALARLRAENLRLTKIAAEAQRGAADEAELVRLQSEANNLEARIEDAVQTKRDAELTAQRGQEMMAARPAPGVVAIDAGAQDRMPRATVRIPPVYPSEMRKAGITGAVTVGFVVDALGTVRDAVALKSTRPEFEEAAVAAVAQWKFDPGLKGNRVVNTRIEQVISFSLAGSPPAAGDAKPVENPNWF